MLWMCQLRHQHGRSSILERETHSNEDTSHSEHRKPSSKRLEKDANNDDGTADQDRVLSSNPFYNPPQPES